MLPSDRLRPVLAGHMSDGHARAHTPLYCGIQYNHSGRLRLRVNGASYDLSGAWAFLTYPGTRFEYEFYGDTPHFARCLCMDPASMRPYIQSGLFPIGAPPTKIRHPARFSHSLDATLALIEEGRPRDRDRIVWRVEDLLLQLGEQNAPTFGRSRAGHYLEALVEDIRRSPELERDWGEAAGHLGVTPRHFRRLFEECAGLSPTRFVVSRRMHAAKRFLSAAPGSVAEVARRVGIDNPFYFSRLFKQHFGLSPLAYRREFSSRRPSP